MEVNGQLHAPASLPTLKKFPLPTEHGAVWSPEPVQTFRRTSKSTAPTGNRVPSLQLMG